MSKTSPQTSAVVFVALQTGSATRLVVSRMKVNVLRMMFGTTTTMLSRMLIVLARVLRTATMMADRMLISSIRACRVRMIRASSREDRMAGRASTLAG
jgi:hypothetical protein